MNTQPGNKGSSLNTAFQIYSLYRLLQSITLLILFFTGTGAGYLGKQNPLLFLVCATLYTLFCLISLTQGLLGKLPDKKGTGILFVFLVDVIAISSFIHFSGGLHGSLGILMVVIVATAGIFLQGRLALFIAALASLAILLEQIYLYSYVSGGADNFAATGILGLALFAAALIVQQLAERLRASEQLLSAQSEQVYTLEKLNEQIIERMPSGVIVVDTNMVIQFMNTAAWRLLLSPRIPEKTPLGQLSPQLAQQLKLWRNNPGAKPDTFKPNPSATSLSANFAQLGDGEENNQKNKSSGTIIFIEDASLMAERAQKMKLASLGTLTAGIAHEIRNPLGAISHAAQLLQESENLESSDQRLTDIIQQHSIRMNRIIENVLQLSRQKTGKQESIKLANWLKEFVREFRGSKNQAIECHLELDDTVDSIQINTSQLTQVLTNLAENGLRYSQEHSGIPFIKIHCGRLPQNNCHYIDIIDRGPGISDEQVEHIFEPFYTTDSKGSGLGLYIAKELCVNNRCTLDYIPMPEGGSSFRITFPE